MRVVLYTSVLVAAIRSDRGAAKVLVNLILISKVTLLLNYLVACEYRAVGLRRDHLSASKGSQGEIARLIQKLEDVAEPVEIFKSYRPLSPDPNDDLVLDLAINGRADAIVTNNIRHLREPAARFHIAVLDARMALGTIKSS